VQVNELARKFTIKGQKTPAKESLFADKGPEGKIKTAGGAVCGESG
jgi:hypothetical protein